MTHRQRRATARITVELGQHHAGQRQGVVEGLGSVDGILAEHRIDHKQRFGRLEPGVQRGDLLHHRLVDTEAAGRIDDQHVVVVLLGPVERRGGNVYRLLVGLRGEEVSADLLRNGLQLRDGGGAIHVARHRQHFLLLVLFEPLGELADRGGLARALQAGHQDDRGRRDVEVQLGGAAAHDVAADAFQRFLAADDGRQLALHDADQRLARRKARDDVFAERLFLDAGNEFAHDRQRHVGFEQRQADFAQHLGGVGFGQARFAAHGLDHAREPLGQVIQHDSDRDPELGTG